MIRGNRHKLFHIIKKWHLYNKKKLTILIIIIRALFQKWARGGNASNNCTVFAMLLKNLEIKKAIQAFSDNICEPKIHYFGALADDFWTKFMREDFIKEEICIEACEIFKGYSSPMATCIINVIKGSRSILSFTAYELI